MPASSVSALDSWGVYLVAAAALVLMLSPSLAATAKASREGADLRYLEGVRAVLASLRPGVGVEFSFGGWPPSDPITMDGNALTCSYGGGALELNSSRALPGMTLYPGVLYLAQLSSGAVEVTRVG
ncbi:MAG: hypothetical protein JRM73_00380 [Nitrososphaerota archaeon]|nr:hypothetical protein [Nitrososphaerota archaeon]